ncbi:MAG: 5,10-methylenetetrahydrofolate reductase [Candidatus Manganitrophaceae bacterium]|nr:MAG: 5,10-methylenetetrahydrofolate reductase [Candidatus Manganitrophaceae bacterium]
MKRLKEAITSGEFLLTAECLPPKGTDISRFRDHAERLLGKVHAVNVNDNPAAIVHASPLALSKVLLDIGHDPVCQITGRDRNRLAIQSDLLGLQILGVRNVLCLTGDDITVGDQKEGKAVFDLESVEILKTVVGLNEGKDLSGKPIEGATSLLPGAAVSPEAEPLAPALIQSKKKIEAGARFFQTQAIFNPDRFDRFMEEARKFSVKIIAGVFLLRSLKTAQYVNEHIPGIRVPERFLQKLERAGKAGELEAGMEIALELIESIKRKCDGIHLMAVGAEEQISVILERAGLVSSGGVGRRAVGGAHG